MVVIAKALIFQVTDDTNSSLGMAFIMAGFSLGLVVGPVLGGILLKTVVKFSKSRRFKIQENLLCWYQVLYFFERQTRFCLILLAEVLYMVLLRFYLERV